MFISSFHPGFSMASPHAGMRTNDPYRTDESLSSVLAPPDHPVSDHISSDDAILLIRLGGIGDAIRLLPTAVFLRNTGFEGTLHAAVEPPVDQVFNCTSYFDDVHAISLNAWGTNLTDILNQIDRVRSHPFDWIFDCHGILKSGVLSRLCRARRRVGYHPDNSKELNALFQDVTISKLPDRLPRLLKYLQLVRPFLGTHSLDNDALKPMFDGFGSIDPEIFSIAERKPIVIHPTSSSGRYGARKDWGTTNFRIFISRIIQDTGQPICITWGPGERDVAEEIAKPFPDRVMVSPPTQPITNLMHLIQHAQMLVTIDSSPVHFADLLATPQVIIFGVGKSRVNGPFFSPYRMTELRDDEQKTSDISVDRVHRAFIDLQESAVGI
jgi:ADP-heptose:LPS heptosyltransferase